MQYNSFRKMPPKKKDKKGEAEAKRWLLEYDDNGDRGDIDDDPFQNGHEHNIMMTMVMMMTMVTMTNTMIY